MLLRCDRPDLKVGPRRRRRRAPCNERFELGSWLRDVPGEPDAAGAVAAKAARATTDAAGGGCASSPHHRQRLGRQSKKHYETVRGRGGRYAPADDDQCRIDWAFVTDTRRRASTRRKVAAYRACRSDRAGGARCVPAAQIAMAARRTARARALAALAPWLAGAISTRSRADFFEDDHARARQSRRCVSRSSRTTLLLHRTC